MILIEECEINQHKDDDGDSFWKYSLLLRHQGGLTVSHVFSKRFDSWYECLVGMNDKIASKREDNYEPDE